MRVDFNIRLGRIQLQGINLYPQKSYEAFQSWSDLWQPTPVFLPGESYGQKSLAGYSPWGHKESDTTEQLNNKNNNNNSYIESSRIITRLRVPFLQGLYVLRILTPDKSNILKKEFLF